MKRGALLLAVIGLCDPAAGQSFQCRIGQDAACLDWGETVCASGGKCVRESAACFDAYQCDYKGFACRSDVDQCIEAHDRITRDYSALLADYETLRGAGQQLAESHDVLQRELEDLRREVRELENARAEIDACLAMAESVTDAKLCAY